MTDRARDEQLEGNLTQLIDQLARSADESTRLSVGDLVAVIGGRTFAPLVLVAGLVMLAPVIGDVPGVPVLMGALVVLVVVQMLMHRRHLWLPSWLEKRSVSAERVSGTVRWLRKPAAFLDRWARPRMTWAVRHGGFVVIAVVCIGVAAATPIMGVVPFSANLAGTVITIFGLALVSRDGLLALVAMVLAAGMGGVIGWNLL
jgi:hypothetical protein